MASNCCEHRVSNHIDHRTSRTTLFSTTESFDTQLCLLPIVPPYRCIYPDLNESECPQAKLFKPKLTKVTEIQRITKVNAELPDSIEFYI